MNKRNDATCNFQEFFEFDLSTDLKNSIMQMQKSYDQKHSSTGTDEFKVILKQYVLEQLRPLVENRAIEDLNLFYNLIFGNLAALSKIEKKQSTSKASRFKFSKEKKNLILFCKLGRSLLEIEHFQPSPLENLQSIYYTSNSLITESNLKKSKIINAVEFAENIIKELYNTNLKRMKSRPVQSSSIAYVIAMNYEFKGLIKDKYFKINALALNKKKRNIEAIFEVPNKSNLYKATPLKLIANGCYLAGLGTEYYESSLRKKLFDFKKSNPDFDVYF